MSVETWAKKIAAAVLIEPGERAPMDAVLVEFLDEFEDLMRTTRLKIPAFARALTAAGLTLSSGAPYSSATLRTQISRARAKREARRHKVEVGSISDRQPMPATANVRHCSPQKNSMRERQQTATSGNESILMRLSQSKPRRVRSLDIDEA